jgi:hypothetical protein
MMYRLLYTVDFRNGEVQKNPARPIGYPPRKTARGVVGAQHCCAPTHV